MDLPEIGAHCSLSSCNELDFLPIKCNCGKLFCKKHIQQEIHDCVLIKNVDTLLTNSANLLRRCALADCSKPAMDRTIASDSEQDSLDPSTSCPECHLMFCAEHRFPSSHSCSPIARPTTTEKNARARELLKKNFPQSSSGSEKQTTSRIVRSRNTPAAQAQIMKVQSMKIRQTARPGDPKTTFLRPSERHNVLIKFDETNTEKTLWFDKSVSTGRVLDLLSGHFNLLRSDKNPLRLYLVSDWTNEDSSLRLALDRPLSAQTEDGCKLIMTRRPEEDNSSDTL